MCIFCWLGNQKKNYNNRTWTFWYVFHESLSSAGRLSLNQQAFLFPKAMDIQVAILRNGSSTAFECESQNRIDVFLPLPLSSWWLSCKGRGEKIDARVSNMIYDLWQLFLEFECHVFETLSDAKIFTATRTQNERKVEDLTSSGTQGTSKLFLTLLSSLSGECPRDNYLRYWQGVLHLLPRGSPTKNFVEAKHVCFLVIRSLDERSCAYNDSETCIYLNIIYYI